MVEKRRLPVLQASTEAPPPRPPWQWSLFGAGLIVLAWLLLAMLTSPLISVIVGSGPAADEAVALHRVIEAVLVQLASLLLASFGSGLVLGVWGPGGMRAEAGFAGGLVAAGAIVLTAIMSHGFAALGTWGVLIVVPCASGASLAGAMFGARRKRVLPP
jgi:hypothetical protein